MKGSQSLAHAYEIGMQVAKFELSIEAESRSTKKKYYLALFSDLESNNIPKNEIVRKAHDIIEKALQTLTKDQNTRFNNDSWFYEVSRELNYSAEPTLKNSSDSTPELLGECTEQRAQYIQLLDDIINLSRLARSALEQKHKEFDEHGNEITITYDWPAFFEMDGRGELMRALADLFYQEKKEWEQMIDTRQSIIPRMRFIVTELLSVVTNKDFCTNYYAMVKRIQNITPKKLTQFVNDVFPSGKMSGKTANSRSQLFDLFLLDSMDWNTLNLKCPDCKSDDHVLRIKHFENGTWFFICKNWQYHKQDETLFPATLFSDRLKMLSINEGGSSTKHLKKMGIDVKSN